MKKTLVLFFAMIWGLSAVFAENLSSRVKQKVGSRSKTLEMVFSIEEPTQYQKDQIRAAVEQAVQAAKKQKFTDLASLIYFLNRQFTQEDGDSTLLKMAFPEKEGAKPAGFLDCDSRALLVLAGLEQLGYPFGRVWPVSVPLYAIVPNHVVLSDGKDLYDLLTNDSFVLSKDNNLINVQDLDTPRKIESLLLTNKGSFFGVQGDREKAASYYTRALKAYPDNLTALLNLFRVGQGLTKLKAGDRVMRVYAANYWRLQGRSGVTADKLSRKDLIQAVKGNHLVAQGAVSFVDSCAETAPREYLDMVVYWGALLTETEHNPMGLYGFKTGIMLFKLGRFKEMVKAFDESAKRLAKDAGLPAENVTARDLPQLIRTVPWNNFDSQSIGISLPDWWELFPGLREQALVAANTWLAGKIILAEQEVSAQAFQNIRQDFALAHILLMADDELDWDSPRIPMWVTDIINQLKSWKGCRNFINTLNTPNLTAEGFCK